MTDFDRPLDQRGLRDAPNMAKLLKAEGLKPDIIYTSDANRAQTTANFFASEFDMEINKNIAFITVHRMIISMSSEWKMISIKPLHYLDTIPASLFLLI